MDYIGFYNQYVEKLKQAGSQYKGLCPFHPEDDPSFFINPDNGLWHCFGCGKGGNARTFCTEKRLPVEQAPDYDPNYITHGYSGGAIHKRSVEKKKGGDRIERWEGEKEARNKTPFNMQAIDLAREKKKTLWICEGESDTLCLWDSGEMAIGVPGAGNTKVLDGISLTGIPRVIVAGDRDKAGETFSEDVLNRFPFAEVVDWPPSFQGRPMPKSYDVKDHKETNPKGFISDLEGWAVGVDPYESLVKQLGDKLERDMSRDPDKPLGYGLTRFGRLSENIDGVQPGFYVVGAETNTGKTAFLCNLTLDLLQSNEDLAGIYFSLDDNRDVILNRFLAILTDFSFNQVQRPPKTDNHLDMLKKGYDYLTLMANGKRLFIRDSSEIEGIEDLELEIKRRMNRKLFVVIDGLYNLDVGAVGDQRKENIERANRLKAIADVYRIPVICTGELRKKDTKTSLDKTPTIHDLMETGKFAYNANLVLLIYPDNWEDYDKEDKPTLNLKYAKNKLSHYRRIDSLKFTRDTGQLKEV